MEGTIKQPRFMKEYANRKINNIYSLMAAGTAAGYPYAEKISQIIRVQVAYERGLITVDEAMQEIAKA